MHLGSRDQMRLGPDPEPLGIRYDVIMARLAATRRPAPRARALVPTPSLRRQRVPVG